MNPVYRALGGPPYYLTPRDVDEIELWMVAEMLGVNPDRGWIATLVPEPGEGEGGVTPDEFHDLSVRLNEERMRRAKAGLPDLDDADVKFGSTAAVLPPGMMASLPVRRGRSQPGRQ